MKEITFVTGNERKMIEATAACSDAGIKVNQFRADIDEIQHHDSLKISVNKAEQAYERTGKPTIINDESWNIPALNGFPGGYMKDVNEWFTPEDFIVLMSNKTDRRICCNQTIIYIDDHQTKVFSKEYWGEFSYEPRGIGNSLERVAVFNGKTFGEFKESDELAFDPKDFIWQHFVDWYTKNT